MKALLPYEDRKNLVVAVFDALQDAFHNLSLHEPQLVANLVWQLPQHINKTQFTTGTLVSAGGIFVHARPLVTCKTFPEKTPVSVEIGDLLLIYTLVLNGNVKERRALLLQAKKTDSIPATPDNRNQWHLYEKWPQFTYAARSGKLKGERRYISEPDMYDAAKYLLIGKNCEHCCADWPFHWPEICNHHTAQPTSPDISRYRCFFRELIALFTGNGGKCFDQPKPGVNGWDQVIDDLINDTAKAKSVFSGRATGSSVASPRGNGMLFISAPFSRYSVLLDQGGIELSVDGPPAVPRDWPGGSNEGGAGISIIEVTIERESSE